MNKKSNKLYIGLSISEYMMSLPDSKNLLLALVLEEMQDALLDFNELKDEFLTENPHAKIGPISLNVPNSKKLHSSGFKINFTAPVAWK